MSEEEQNTEEEVQPPAMGGMLLTMLFMMYIIMNPGLRTGMGEAARDVLEPQIGFDHIYPVLTFLCAGGTSSIDYQERTKHH